MRGKAAWAFLGGFGLGALAMYFLDPSTGTERREAARDRVVTAGRRTRGAIREGSHEVVDRARGVAAKAKSTLRERIGGSRSDDDLAQRVRSALGRIVSHANQIRISASNGVVTLAGTVTEEEGSKLSSIVRGVDGVKDVIDQTQIREDQTVG